MEHVKLQPWTWPTCSAGEAVTDGCRAEDGGYRASAGALNPGQEILKEALPLKSPVIRLPTALYLGIRARGVRV